MFEIEARKRRTADHTITLYQADGSGFALAATDVVRVKIGRGDGATPTLDLDSVAATGNGSLVTITQTSAPAQVTLRLAQADLSSLLPGIYEVEIAVVDDSETDPADAIKHVEEGVLYLHPTLAGDVGLA